MKEHALPQDVTGYKFHIIGNMTLKQFAEVAAGVGVGFLIYFTNLPDLIKWPLILTFSGVGALAAFVPFEERPLDHWLMSLFKALYRPTQFYWKRVSKIPESLLYEPKAESHSMVKEVDLTPARRMRVKEYLHSVSSVEEPDAIEQYSTQRLSDVMNVFDEVVYQPQPQIQPQVESPTVVPQPEMTAVSPVILPEKVVVESPQAEPNWPTAPATVLPVNAQIGQQNSKVSLDTRLKKADPNATVPMSISQGTITGGVQIKTKPNAASTLEAVASAANMLKQGVEVPEMQGIRIEPKHAAEFGPRTTPPQDNRVGDTYITAQNLNTNAGPQATQTAVQDKSLPFPAKPTQPNKIVGMAIDQNNVPLSNVIIEILTPDGIPARAVKTNILGQFFITTPLGNGVYTISAEKEGYTFPPQSLELTGQLLDPIEVRSQ